ncbi:MAG: hypothetical protein R3C10_23245 [Pirellulales bacterium]
MPKTNSPPNYGHHNPGGQARVVLNGRHFCLGSYESAESRTEYAKLIAGWKPEPPAATIRITLPGQLTVNELTLRYLYAF